jgi:alpha-D-ribose 1-methylphosphonate 5-phosphate C-P lyase
MVSMADDLGVLELGRLHPADRCAYCGARWQRFDIRVLLETRARGLVCHDTVACMRRSQRAKQMRLFGAA